MKKLENKVLNFPLMQKTVHEKHQKFIKKYGMTIEKVMADHRLFVDIIVAKISGILSIYEKEGVISQIKVLDDGVFRTIIISKPTYYTTVNISTNGKVIYLAGQTYAESFDADLKCPIQKFFKVDAIDFDWIEFNNVLLDYVHKTIYARQEVLESMMGNIFNEER